MKIIIMILTVSMTHLMMRMPLSSFLALSLSACNTIRGAGQDVEEAGEEIQDTAD